MLTLSLDASSKTDLLLGQANPIRYKFRIFGALALGALLPFCSSAQSGLDADAAWREVMVAGAPVASARSATITKEQADADQKSQATRFVRASDKARQFYQNFPSHPKAAEAKRLEVVGLLRAVQTGDVTVEHKAERLARDFEANTENPKRDRFVVASLVKQMAVRKKQMKTMEEMAAAYEKNADDLMADYSDVEDVYELYIGVVRNAPPETAKRVAHKILNIPAPARIKEQAQAVLDRLELPGKKIDLELTTIDQGDFVLSAQKGKVVVIYFWATWAKGSMAALPEIKKVAASDVVLLGVNMDSDLDTAKKAIVSEELPGYHHFDQRGLNGSVATKLHVGQLPAVYVINPNGTLTGLGTARDLSALLVAARN